jgi:hypothetical protein
MSESGNAIAPDYQIVSIVSARSIAKTSYELFLLA